MDRRAPCCFNCSFWPSVPVRLRIKAESILYKKLNWYSSEIDTTQVDYSRNGQIALYPAKKFVNFLTFDFNICGVNGMHLSVFPFKLEHAVIRDADRTP